MNSPPRIKRTIFVIYFFIFWFLTSFTSAPCGHKESYFLFLGISVSPALREINTGSPWSIHARGSVCCEQTEFLLIGKENRVLRCVKEPLEDGCRLNEKLLHRRQLGLAKFSKCVLISWKRPRKRECKAPSAAEKISKEEKKNAKHNEFKAVAPWKIR